MLMEAEKRKYPGGEDGIVEKKQAVLDRSRSEMGSFDSNDSTTSLAVEVAVESLSAGPVTEVIDCPQNRVSAIIGSKGSVIQEMKRRSCCKISVYQDMPVGHPRKIVVVGLAAGAELAKEMCLKIIEGGAVMIQNPALFSTGDDVSLTVTRFTRGMLNTVAGPGGSTRAELVGRTGVELCLSMDEAGEAVSSGAHSADAPESAPSGWIRITGKKIPLLETKTLVATLLAGAPLPPRREAAVVGASSAPFGGPAVGGPQHQGPRPPAGGPAFLAPTGEGIVIASHYNQAVLAAQQMGITGAITTSEMDIAQEKVSTVIGAKGVVISQIMKLSGCRITILQEHVPEGCPRKAHFTGTVQQIGAAMVFMANVIALGPDCVMKGANNTLAKNAPHPLHVTVPAHVHPGGQAFSPHGTGQYQNHSSMSMPIPQHHFPSNTVIQEVTMLQSQLTTLTSHPAGDLIHRLQHMCDIAITIGDDNSNADQKIVKMIGEREQVQHVLQALFQTFQHSIDPLAALAAIPPVKPYAASGPARLPVASIPQHPHPPYPPPGAGMVVSGAGVGPSSPSNRGGGRVLALGGDGMSGYLYERLVLPDGFFEQVAMVKRAVCGRVVGKGGANLALFKAKSGALVSVEKTNDAAKLANPDDLTRVVMVGDDAATTLGAQLLQEIISYGTKSLADLPDVQFSLPPGYKIMNNGPTSSRPPQPVGYSAHGYFYPHSPQRSHQGYQALPNGVMVPPFVPQGSGGESHYSHHQSPPPQSAPVPPDAGAGGPAAPPNPAPVPPSTDVYPNIARINLNSNPNPSPAAHGAGAVEVAPALKTAQQKPSN